jgi:hypothetical protein
MNRIQESDPITNDLSEPLKPFSGNDLRLITNDLQGRLIIPDEAWDLPVPVWFQGIQRIGCPAF